MHSRTDFPESKLTILKLRLYRVPALCRSNFVTVYGGSPLSIISVAWRELSLNILFRRIIPSVCNIGQSSISGNRLPQ